MKTGKHSFPSKCVPKYNLGTRRRSGNCEQLGRKGEEAGQKARCIIQPMCYQPAAACPSRWRGAALASIAFAAFLTSATAAPLQFSSPYTPTSQASKTSQTVTGTPEGLTNDPDALFHRESLLGDLDGYRNLISDDGLSITPILVLEAFSSAGGGHGGADADGLFDVAFDFDLERITRGLLADASLHLNVLDIFGSSITGRHVGDISGVSNLAGYNTFRLQEIWLQQNLFKKRVSIRFGMLAADTEFFTSQAASLFLDGTFGAFTLVALNFNDAPVYPVAAPGVRLDVAPVSFLDFKVAVFGPNQGSENNTHGTDFSINSRDGALVAFEASYLVNQSPNDRGLIGTYKLGTFIQQGDYTSFGSQAINALDSHRPLHRGTNVVGYGVADQELFKNGQYTVEAFARVGFGTPNYSFVHNYFDLGLNFIGFVPTRFLDVAGVAVGRSGISNQFSAAQVRQGSTGYSQETVVEATYRIQLAPWATIQPDFQYFINPSAQHGSRDAFVSGIRTVITF